MTDELKPCRMCGGECTVQKIDTDQVTETLWVCRNDAMFGGDCTDGRAYFSVDAWNTRATTTKDSQ
jgi:hypothetical protein